MAAGSGCVVAVAKGAVAGVGPTGTLGGAVGGEILGGYGVYVGTRVEVVMGVYVGAGAGVRGGVEGGGKGQVCAERRHPPVGHCHAAATQEVGMSRAAGKGVLA